MTFAAKVSEVPNWGKKVVTIEGTEVLLVNIKGVIYACENECPHQGSPMQGGIIKDDQLSCPRHGYRFDLKTGACSAFPEYTLKIYPIEIRGDDIFVSVQ
jgi:nitrite reductase/ring-hydroxylating ferredoxin subunit